ncbi:KilA-N domain-containing protein [Vibrio alginolyticus]|uniref:KilA-N domain-containing protein n=1 Tax=Vibrio alginolyticus TaxID=663 RepID=UPI00237B94C2|nr:KilA-N domain-containing protein [Vibrio alginolyticus]
MGRNGGTWGHPKLAVFFARWLSPAFAVLCDAVIDDILNKKASLTIDKPEESFAMQVPKSLPEALRMAADLAEKNEKLQLERDGMVKTIGQTDQTISLFARTLPGVNCIKTKSDLKRLGYLTASLGWW